METPPGPDTTPQGPTSVDHKPKWLPLIPLKPNAWPAPNGDTIQSQSDETSPNRLSSGLIDLSGSDTGLHTTAEICEAATLTIDRLCLLLRSRPQQTLLSPDDIDRAVTHHRARGLGAENVKLEEEEAAAPANVAETRAREVQVKKGMEKEIAVPRSEIERKNEQIRGLCESVKRCDAIIDAYQEL